MTSTSHKYCYELCEGGCYQKHCESVFVVVKGERVPCLFVPPSGNHTKARCLPDKSCEPNFD